MTLGASLATMAGLYLALFSCLIYLAWRAHDQVAAGVIAGIMVFLGIWHFIDLRVRSGRAAMNVAIGHVALGWGVVLAILNLRMDVWLAAYRGIDVAAIHRLLPAWAIPLATLALLVWTGLLIFLTKPRISASPDERP